MSVLEGEAFKTKAHLAGIAILCIGILLNAVRADVGEGRTDVHLQQQQEQVEY